MGGGDDVTFRDQDSSADVFIDTIQDDRCPRKLAEFSLE